MLGLRAALLFTLCPPLCHDRADTSFASKSASPTKVVVPLHKCLQHSLKIGKINTRQPNNCVL